MNPVRDSIFISYRRNDSNDLTGRLYDRLVDQFGREAIFRDVDTIPLGADFVEYIRGGISECKVGLIIVGPRWLEAREGTSEPRLYDPKDHVRLEVRELLNAPNIVTIPVFAAGAICPAADLLPEELRPLALRNGLPLRSDPDFGSDATRLIVKLCEILGIDPSPSEFGFVRRKVEDLVAEEIAQLKREDAEEKAKQKRDNAKQKYTDQRLAEKARILQKGKRKEWGAGALFYLFYLFYP